MIEEFNRKITLTHDRLLSIIKYLPETGEMVNIVPRKNSKCVGEKLGARSGNGQIMLSVDGRAYQMHRLAWFWMTGEWPKNLIDHKDRDPTNNKWSNLRESDRAQNGHNANKKRNNTTGITGIWYCKKRKKYIAEIFVRGVKISLGASEDKQVAAELRAEAEKKYFGKYAANN